MLRQEPQMQQIPPGSNGERLGNSESPLNIEENASMSETQHDSNINGQFRKQRSQNNPGNNQNSPGNNKNNLGDNKNNPGNNFPPTSQSQVLSSLLKPTTNQSNYKSLLAQRPPNGPSSFQNNLDGSFQDEARSALNSPPNKGATKFQVSVKKNQKLSKCKSSQKTLLASKSNCKQTGFTQGKEQIRDITVLMLLYKVIERMRTRGDDMTLQCLLNEQKLIHITIALVQKRLVSLEDLSQYYSLQKEIVAFVQKINKVTMQNFKDEDQNLDIKIFAKSVDLLMTPNLHRFVKDLKTLGKVKVLTFNNLACIYKKKKKFGIALRSVSFALQIEQALTSQQANQQKYDIIPTYLNKAAILSQMNKHQKAIQQIMKCQKFVQKIQKEVIKQISQAEQQENEQLKKRLEEKRYYGLYMKMIINYNMGAEKEHMKMVDSACEYYKQGRQLAIVINNQFMVKKFEGILNNIMDGRKR